MFGIGLPEMIVILAVALVVVGPDKLPELARSLAKGVNDLKNTMNQVKDSLNEETKVVGSVKEELQQTAGQMKTRMLEDVTTSPKQWKQEGDDATDTAFTQEDQMMEGEAPYSRPEGEAQVAQDKVIKNERPSNQSERVEQAPEDGGKSVELDVELGSKGQNTEEKDSSASGPGSVA